VTESRDDSTATGAATGTRPEARDQARDDQRAPRSRSRPGMTRRGWTVLVSGVLIVVFGLLGAFVRVPYVAIGPGPTYDTLGEVNKVPVVQIDGQQTYPTSGQLRMTTVSLNDEVSLFGALGLWASGRYALAPREEYFRPGESDEQVQQQNVQQFQDSQSNAEVAALRHLGFPIKVLAQTVVEDAPASKILTAGDRLLNINGTPITNEDDVSAAVADTTPGQTVPITFQHGSEPPRTEQITLTTNPDPDQKNGFMGLQPIDRADVPFEVKISLQDVGGPSAGLMFALAIIDRLTPGEMVGGEHIAGTGEINEKGLVGAIGGISFKLVAAREEGANVFLTPAANCAEAASAAPDGLKLIKVTDLDSALSALDALTAGRPTPSC